MVSIGPFWRTSGVTSPIPRVSPRLFTDGTTVILFHAAQTVTEMISA